MRRTEDICDRCAAVINAAPEWKVAWFPTYRRKLGMVGEVFWFHFRQDVIGPVKFLRYTKQGHAVVEHDERLPVDNQFANQKRGRVYHSTVFHCRLFTWPIFAEVALR